MANPPAISIHPEQVTATYWRYAWPTVVAMLASGLYQVVDGIFIGQAVGAPGLAAINMAWPWIGLVAGVGLMIGTGVGTYCSIAQGRGDTRTAANMLAQGIWLMVLSGLLVGASVLWGREVLLMLQGADAQVLDLGVDYLTVMGAAAPGVIASIALPIWVRNLGAPRLATLMMVIGALLNILLDYLFIVRFGWSLTGAALATVIGESASVVIGLVFLFTRYSAVPLRVLQRPFPLPKRAECAAIVGNGLSSFLMYVYASFVTLVHNAALMKYGHSVHVAAFAIAGYIMTIYYYLAEGLALAMQPIVSYFHGRNLPGLVRQVFFLALKWIMGIGIVLVVLISVFPRVVVNIFIGEEKGALAEISVDTLRLHFFALFLEGFMVLAATYLQAIGDSRRATIVTLGNLFVQLPLLFGLPPWLGVMGIWLALPISTILLSIVVAKMVRQPLKVC